MSAASCSMGVTFRLWRSGQVYAVFLADFPVMALDVGNQLTGSLIDGSRLARSSGSSLPWLQLAIYPKLFSPVWIPKYWQTA